MTTDWKKAALRLWMLLDDIDTLDDACRSSDATFRDAVRRTQRKRFGVIDGAEFDNRVREYPELTQP